MPRPARGMFERLLEETGLRARRPRPEPLSDEGTAELFLLAQRLRGLRSVRAPARLRSRVLAEVREQPSAAPLLQPAVFADLDSADLEIAQRLRDLPSMHAPAHLRARALAPSRDWQNARRVVPLAEVRRARARWVNLAARAVAAAGIVIFAGYSTYAVSASPLPGSPFYPVKLLIEDVQVKVANPSDRPHILVHQAGQRLDESRRLTESKQYPEAEKTLGDAERLIESARASADQAERPEQVRSAAADVEVQAQEVAQKIPQHPNTISVALPNLPAPAVKPPSEPAAALPLPAASDPLVAPQAPDPAVVAPNSGAPNPVVAPISPNVDVIAGRGTDASLPAGPSSPIVAGSGGAPPAQFRQIETNTAVPTRTATGAGAASTAKTPPTPKPSGTAARTSTPTTAAPPSPTSAQPQSPASPVVAAPVGTVQEIPPK